MRSSTQPLRADSPKQALRYSATQASRSACASWRAVSSSGPLSSASVVAVVSSPLGIASGLARKPSTPAHASAISSGVGRPQS